MRDHRPARLRLPYLAQFLIHVAGVDGEVAGRAERLTVSPGETGDDGRVDHGTYPM